MFVRYLYILSMLFLSCSFNLKATERGSIKVVVFDFGSVIAKTDKQEVARFIANHLHISENEAVEAMQQLKESNRAGLEEEETFWAVYAKQNGLILPDHWQRDLDEAKFKLTQAVPGMIELVKDLQQQGYQTALLSNISKNHANVKRRLGYYDLFSPALLSYEIGTRKPDPKAFQILLSQLQVPPQEIVFIDNQSKNVEAARSLGIDSILFVGREQLIQELKKRGIRLTSDMPIQ